MSLRQTVAVTLQASCPEPRKEPKFAHATDLHNLMARAARRPLTASLRAPRFHAARLALIVFTLFAFALQTFVVQTHIHGSTSAGAVIGKSAVQERQPSKLPPGGDPANCPICQELLHAGAYVTPAAATWQPVAIATFIEVVVFEARSIRQIHSHGWNSRAPPRI